MFPFKAYARYGFICMREKIKYKDHSAYDATEYLLMQTWKLQNLMNIIIIGTGVCSRGMISVPWKSKGLDLIVVELY